MKKQERFEILLEDIQSKFDLVLEGHGALHEKIDRTGQQLGERIDMVEVQISALNQKIDTVEVSLTAKIDKVEAKIDGVAADLAAHRIDTEAHHGIRVV